MRENVYVIVSASDCMREGARRRTLSVAPSGRQDNVSSISREVKRIYAPIRIEAAACLTICSYSS